MRVLVTGGNGFLGFEAVRRLAERGDTAIALDALAGPELLALASENKSVIPAAGDITDLATLGRVFKTHRPDAVLHFAALVGVPASVASPINVVRVNVEGSINVYEAMRLFDVRRVIHLSSEEVYGDFEGLAATEELPQKPRNAYGISKLTVEQLGRFYQEHNGMECINVRTSWVYGVRLARPRPPMNYLNAALSGRALRHSSGGDTVTDYTYVDDVITGVLQVLDHPRHRYDTYNIASGKAVSDFELVEVIKELLPNARLEVGPGRREFLPGVRIPLKGALDCSRALQEIGYAPAYDIRRGCMAYVQAWRKRNTAV